MNILPLVFAFILIFSFLTLGFIRERNFSSVCEKSVHSFHKTSRVVLNNVAKKQYNRVKKAAPPATKAPASSSPVVKSRGKYHSRRQIFPPVDNSKFNLCPLLELQTDPKRHPLYQICAHFLRILYEDSLFKHEEREHIEYDLLNALIKKYQSTKEIKSLSELYPESPELQPLFYKILKGTNKYDIEAASGIPPFEDFFCLEKAPSIHFSFASTPLLEALFGKKNALKILDEEKKKFETTGTNASLPQNELAVLLAVDPKYSGLILELGPDLDFSQKQPKRCYLSGEDKTSGLIIKKKTYN